MLDLPMLGQTHGSRSAVTCHLKCDSACAFPAPNPSTENTFAEIASRQLSRRRLLVSAGAVTAAATLSTSVAERAAAARRLPAAGGLEFEPIASIPAAVDAVTVPAGYRWTPVIRWGDPLFWNSPAFDPEVPDAEAQELQFGYNND